MPQGFLCFPHLKRSTVFFAVGMDDLSGKAVREEKYPDPKMD